MTPADTYEKQIAEILRALGIENRFRKRQPVPEATELVSVGRDIYGREQKLAPNAAAAWIKMKQAAEADGKFLSLVSAFRSVAYQRQIIERKLVAGQAMEQILQVSAAPGFSQHHSGNAVDVTTRNCQPLTEEFERTAEFLWLARRAKDFAFVMTYPRDNPFGVVYEPWHWAFQDPVAVNISPSMQVRQASVADALNIARIHVAAWQAAYRGQMPETVLDNLSVEKRAAFWQSHLPNQPLETLVAELDDEIAGFCDLVPSRDKDSDPKTIAEIMAIYVHPDHWRQGAGRALCRRALETARRNHFTAVTLWTLGSNLAAKKFYETMGFHLDGATKSEPVYHHELHHVRFRISF